MGEGTVTWTVTADEKGRYTHLDPAPLHNPPPRKISRFDVIVQDLNNELIQFKADMTQFILSTLGKTENASKRNTIVQQSTSDILLAIETYKQKIQGMIKWAKDQEDITKLTRIIPVADQTAQEMIRDINLENTRHANVEGVSPVENSQAMIKKAHGYTDVQAQARAAALMQMGEEKDGGQEHKKLWKSAAAAFKKEYGKEMQQTIERMYKWKSAPPSLDAIKSTVRKFMIERDVYPYPAIVSLLVHNPFSERGIVPDFTGDSPFAPKASVKVRAASPEGIRLLKPLTLGDGKEYPAGEAFEIRTEETSGETMVPHVGDGSWTKEEFMGKNNVEGQDFEYIVWKQPGNIIEVVHETA